MLNFEPSHKPPRSKCLLDVSVAGYHSVPDASQAITSGRLYHEFAVPQHPGRKRQDLMRPSFLRDIDPQVCHLIDI